MAGYKITEWDETAPEYGFGAFAFELEVPSGALVYAIRRRNGSFVHMDGSFTRVSLNGSEKAKRENCVNAYMIARHDSFVLPASQEAHCSYLRSIDHDIPADSPTQRHTGNCPDCKEWDN